MRRVLSFILLAILALVGPVEGVRTSAGSAKEQPHHSCCCGEGCGCSMPTSPSPNSRTDSSRNPSPCSSPQAPASPASTSMAAALLARIQLPASDLRVQTEPRPWPEGLCGEAFKRLEQLASIQPRAPSARARASQRTLDRLAQWSLFRI